MKKKLSAIVLALVLALSLLPAAAFAADGDVAQVGEQTYDTVAAAIEAAKDGGTVKLLTDVAEPITIPEGYTVTLDLNGKVLKNSVVPQDENVPKAERKHTITNKGTLTITGDGVVDNVSHEAAALYNDGTVTIKTAMITRSAEKGSTPINNGGNSWYVVFNAPDAVMNVEDGASIFGTSAYSSCVRNDGEMNIKGGYISQDKFIAVKNDSGTLNVTGGVISSNDQAIQNWSTATITGGTFDGDIYTWAYTDNGKPYAGNTTIAGAENEEDISVYINGDVYGVHYDNSAAKAQVRIEGNTLVVGSVKSAQYGSGYPENIDASVVVVAGGVYTEHVREEYVDPSLKVQAKYTDDESDVTFYTFYTNMDAAQADGIVQGEEFTVINKDAGKKVLNITLNYTADQLYYSVEYQVNENDSLQVTLDEPNERDNYTFVGWKSSADGKIYKAGSDVTLSDDVTFTAIWSVKVSYDYGYENKLDVTDVVEGSVIKLPEASREGYTFKGWRDSQKEYQAGDEYTVNAAVTFEAQWEAVKDSNPTNPTNPTNPSNPNTGVAGVSLWVSLLALAGVALVVTLVAGNQKHGRREAK